MAEDGDSSNKQMSHTNRSHHQDKFQRTPEADVDYRHQARSTGIVTLPPGSRGPRSLYLRRHGDNFGFTLRHFIVYPPDSVQDTLGNRHAGHGAILTPMDTIFVKNVAPYSAAEQSGLQHGDRIVAVNGITVTDKTYAQVIHLIQTSPQYLHLLVVPKEDDILQKFFSETAHNPVSNQHKKQEIYADRRKLYRSGHSSTPKSSELHADAVSWHSLQETACQSAKYDTVAAYENNRQYQQQRSADDLLYASPKEISNRDRQYEVIDESNRISRAQPQVPHRKMGRRASEGSTYSNQDFYLDHANFDTTPSEMVVSGATMKGTAKAGFINTAGCRLSLDGDSRRESQSSLTSSIADGSKDSLSSYESPLIGHHKEDSLIMSRLRKNLQQKEEFLRRPSQPMELLTIQREFYSRPKKLDKPVWPPNNEPTKQDSSPRTAKPLHQNFQRVKADIEIERDRVISVPTDHSSGGAINIVPQQKGVTSPYVPTNAVTKIPEASPAPTSLEHPGEMNGAASVLDEDRRLYLNNLQVVSKRAKQFESGRPLPEDDIMLKDRTSFYKSELARLSSKRVIPHVTIRAHEFESRSSEPRRDTSSSSANSQLRRHHRDSRSVDSSEMLKDNDDQIVKMRARSNSADSWGMIHAEKNAFMQQRKNKDHLEEKVLEDAQICSHAQSTTQLIPESVERVPIVAITPPKSPPIRPNQLDLSSPARPASENHLYPSGDSLQGQSISSVDSEENKPLVVRRTKNTNNLVLPDEERVMRRESYLRATGNGPMHVDECSDGDISPQAMRSAHRKWRPPLFPGDIQQLRKLFEDAAYSFGGSISGGSSSSISLDKEKIVGSSTQLEKEHSTAKEGFVNCKISEIDGKRATDRSWKQVWAVLKGPKLYIYKDRPHQSPSDTSEQSLLNGVDISTGGVKIAEDYTKRKHVLRVSATHPYRSELLLQAENTTDLVDWVKVFQEQVPTTSDIEGKVDTTYQQQAVPQTLPAASTQVESSSRLSPQPTKSKLPSLRNRSPTGQSPVSKTRKPSQVNEGLTSPKSKTWRGRVAKQFKRIQGNTSPSSPTAPESSTFGVPLEHCFPSNNNLHVPRIVEVCTEIVESKGLDIIGVYRVPGNSAAITVLTNVVNNSYDGIQPTDPQWNDVHVVSSLLKSFFRKLPDALLTSALYSSFIEADKNEDPSVRMEELRKLINCLPLHHYHTLRHLMLHLRTVTDNCDINKMEARNLAIVFGPTLIRAVQDDMATLVNDMTHNYKIVESLISYANWFFSDDDVSCLNLPTLSPPVDSLNNEVDVVSNRTLLLDNISKVEGLKGEKIHGRELFSSIISAAHRKMRKGTKVNTSQDTKDELGSPTSIKEFASQPNFNIDLKHNLIEHKAGSDTIPTTISEIEKNKQLSKEPWFNYSNEEQFRRRVENFIQETQANLQRHRKTADFYSSNLEQAVSSGLSNVSQGKSSASDSYVLSKTQSASNVFHRPVQNDPTVLPTVQYRSRKTDNQKQVQSTEICSNIGNFDLNQNKELLKSVASTPKPFDRTFLRRGNSTENINSAALDISNTNGSLKKVKYANENEVQRTGSLDSIHNLHAGEDGDLQTSIMKIFDEKQKTLNPLAGPEDLPYADESPEHHPKSEQNKENIPASPKLYRNPSLHKNASKLSKISKEIHISKFDEEKDKDCLEHVPDNERYISNTEKIALNNINNINFSLISGNCTKLRRSESLNKPERTVSPLNNKLKRSESLNKASDRLKRSDSLTKNEKTENNINKRRELTAAARRTNKEFSKLKRKNGMPERSIKRRHTVGGTKDFDKANYWLDNRYQEENKEKCNRTSSPDLSTTRRERLFFEVNLIGPENMVVALRQHLIGARPQSLPEPRIFTVPLESHV